MAEWLAALRSRAYSDGRLHLVETTAAAIILGTLLCLHGDSSGLPTFGPPLLVLVVAILAGAAWLAAGTSLQVRVRRAVRRHAARVLTEGGLLYLALEHQTSATLRPLPSWDMAAIRAANLRGGRSFRQRLQRLIGSYSVSARSIGQPPLPPAVSRTAYFLMVTRLAVFGAFLVLLLVAIAAGSSLSPFEEPMTFISRLCVAAWWTVYLAGATMHQAQRTGVMLAIADVLGGTEDVPGAE